jgi:NAD dependent epimerase/dehydratase family enzyme
MNTFTIINEGSEGTMKLVLAGGSGHLGGILARAFEQQDHEVVILARRTSSHGRTVHWDGRTLGPWAT